MGKPLAVDVADAVLDARDVIESFRLYSLRLADWRETLRRSAAALSQSGGARAVRTAGNLALLASRDLAEDPVVIAQTSSDLEMLVKETRPTGTPAPGDPDPGF